MAIGNPDVANPHKPGQESIRDNSNRALPESTRLQRCLRGYSLKGDEDFMETINLDSWAELLSRESEAASLINNQI